METIPKSDCRKIGFIRKTHGVHGEVVLEFEAEFEESVAEANRFFIEMDGLLVPFFVAEDGMRFKSAKTALVFFDWVETGKYARRLAGNPVYLYASEIIDEPIENTDSQFVGYRLMNEKSEEIGMVSRVDDYSGNVVLTVTSEGGDILIPFSDELLLAVDANQKILTLQLPEGLIE